ncbi:MAG: thiamine-phosphate kinase [Pseudomonadota bacterium]|nr:thiamine-phosphate kinase [Pseudomonadota bacterium]
MPQSGEPAFIQALRALATHPAARGLYDDCAVLELSGETLILTHDMMAEGVHFLSRQDPADIAWKLVATNLSDLASKGAEPLGVLLGYSLGTDDARFVEGLAEALTAFGTPLLGGDTISAMGPRAFGMTALGRATHRPVPLRSGACVGDRLWLTGAVGGAMLGLEALRAGDPDPAASLAYRRPEPLLAQGRALAPHVTAMMDVSDGLLLDAARMARASGVTLAIDGAAVPIATGEARRSEALRWGDDYQLLFTLPPHAPSPVPGFCIGAALPVATHPILLDGVPLNEEDGLGYQHG